MRPAAGEVTMSRGNLRKLVKPHGNPAMRGTTNLENAVGKLFD
jgi:DNA-binding phage protein